MLNVKLSGYWLLLALTSIGLFFYFTISPALNGGEIDEMAFILLWLISFSFVFICLRKVFIEKFKKCLPYEYKDIRMHYGNPLHAFKPRLMALGWMGFRGFYANLDIYADFLVISIFGFAAIIKSKNDLQMSESFLTGNRVDVFEGSSRISLIMSKKQFEIVKAFIETLENKNE